MVIIHNTLPNIKGHLTKVRAAFWPPRGLSMEINQGVKYGKTLSDVEDDFVIILPVIINKDKIEPWATFYINTSNSKRLNILAS